MAASTTTVMDPNGKVTTIHFQGIYETSRTLPDSLGSSTTCYNGSPANCDNTAITLPITERLVTSTLGSVTSKVDGFYNTYGLPTETDEYDFGGTSPLRKTTVSYTGCGVTNANVVDRACAIKVLDGVGIVREETDNNYDTNGNLLTETHSTGGTPSTISRTFTYSSGVLQAATDFNGNSTNFANAAYAYNNAFPTSVKPPLIAATALVWDCNGAVVTKVTDANSQATNILYTDSNKFWRPTEVDYPDGGKTTATYTDSASAFSVASSQLVSTGINHQGTQTLDGLGRVIKSQDTSAGSTVDTTYDSLGRVYSVSNPHGSSGSPSDGITYYSYDALSRVTGITYPDNNTASVSYSGNCATSTDAASKARKVCTDGLGRTISVTEDPSGLAYVTNYTYDALNNLTGVTQGSQTRTYVYDMLSRVTSAATPESGTTNFYYTTSGGALCSGDASAVCRRTDARNITTTYAYDTLNRMTSKSYNDTPRTLTANYFYDVATPNLSNWTGGNLTNTNGRLAYTCTAAQAGSCTSLSTATVTDYDAMGRPADYWQCSPLNCSTPSVWKMHNTYDLAGDLTSWSHPSGATITYSFNGAQQVSQVNDSISDATHPGLIATATYTPFGALNTLTNGCVGTGCVQAQETYAYNNRLQPVMMELGTAGNVAANYCQVYNYYSSVGNPASCAMPTQGTGNNGNLMGSYLLDGSYPAQNHQMTYQYDNLNRLSSTLAQTLGGTPTTIWSQTNSYDQWGNMSCSGSGICASMTYNTGTNRLATLGNQAVSYDAAGNLTQDGTVSGTYRQYSFDAEGHATKQIDTSGSVETDTYNALGQVVESDWPTWQIQDTWDAFGTSLAEWTPMDSQWWGPGIHLGQGGMNLAWNASWSGRPQQTAFLHKDYLGSTRQVTTYSGATGSDLLFYPWGDVWTIQGQGYERGFAGFLGTTDTDEVLYGTPNRQYAHVMGRWLSPDPLAGDVSNPQSLNRYAYALNSPCSYTDPLGLDTCTLNVQAINNAGLAPWQVRLAEFQMQQIFAGTSSSGNTVQLNFNFSGKPDTTLTFATKPNSLLQWWGEGPMGSERSFFQSPTVYIGNIPDTYSNQYAAPGVALLAGDAGVHELVHGLLGIFGGGRHQDWDPTNPNTMMFNGTAPLDVQQNAWSDPNAAIWGLSSGQVSALFGKCQGKHPAVGNSGGGPGGR